MSWDGYVSNMMANGQSTKAAVIGHNPLAVWSNTGFSFSAEPLPAAIGTGVTLDGIKYMFLRYIEDEGVIYALFKKGESGLTIAVTGQTFLVAHYDKPITGPANMNAVASQANYLKSVGF